MKKYFILFVFAFLFGCGSTNSKYTQHTTFTKEEKKESSYNLLTKLNSTYTTKEEKILTIEHLGMTGDVSIIPHLNNILIDNNQSVFWMPAASALERLGIKNAILAQTEYGNIREYEKSYYYVKTLEASNKTANISSDDIEKYQKIIDKFSAWASRFPAHPKVPTIEISIKFFKKICDLVTIERVYANPKKFISKTVQWQGAINEIIMQDQDTKVKLSLITNGNKWYALLDPKKYIPEIYTIGSSFKIEGDIVDFAKESTLEIPIIYIKKIW